MSIDWSKAPADAEFARTWGVEGGPTGIDFYKEDGYGGMLYLDGHRWATALTKPGDPDLVPRPAWHGEGLPPVGTVCEYQWAGVCRQVEIIAHWRAPADFVAIYVPLEDGAHSTECGRAISNAFRPLRTPEQIAAEEREKAIAEITSLLGRSAGISDSNRTRAESLYDAGYRKVEGGDRQGEALQVAVRALRRLESEPGCGCPTPCQCSGPEWSRAEIEGRMGEAEEALRKIAQIQGGAA